MLHCSLDATLEMTHYTLTTYPYISLPYRCATVRHDKHVYVINFYKRIMSCSSFKFSLKSHFFRANYKMIKPILIMILIVIVMPKKVGWNQSTGVIKYCTFLIN